MSAEQTPDIEALAKIIRPWTLCDDGNAFDHGSVRAARAVLESDWLAAAVREAEQRALRELANEIDVNGYGWTGPRDAQRFVQRLRDRADRVAEPQHEAATSGKESEEA